MKESKVFEIVAFLMLIVSVIGIFLGLSLTANMISNMPKTEIIKTSASNLMECRSFCIDLCKENGKTFEHGNFHENSLCECFCV